MTTTPTTTTTDQTFLESLKPGDLKQLASVSADPCVSILMRTHRSGRETQQDPIRLKNLLKQAGDQLEAAGHDNSLLAAITAKTSDHSFWQQQGEGLAIFLTPNDCYAIRLHCPVKEHVCVGSSLFVQPLIDDAESGGEYFVLSLTWHEAKLFRAAGESFNLVETASLPAKFNQLILPRDPEESLQNTSHRSVGNTPGTSTAMFHGQGEGEDKVDADRDHYLSLVGEEVAAAIYNTGLPLLVVATSEVTGHFEAASKVSVDAKVDGSPAEWTHDELREQAHKAITPQLKPRHDEFVERFGAALAKNKGSSDLEEVLTAAKNGRIDSLMVCRNSDGCMQTNQAVIDTLRGDGQVLQCDTESMPANAKHVAAIYRY